ncbi:hypothetical protein [Streptomyces sp. XY593]|uniref:hypothetical protein n=1 Tax=Streptomyces sp. XY593 TaxID=1519483 RepID=UPI0006AF1925|nr:hypothetical protein [Streptomyces sp. XY593]
MSGNAPVDPAEVPVFTGDLAVLDAKVKLISSGGAAVSTKASDVHTSFGGLQAFYQAPEADQLFATTKPVSDLGLKLSTDMCTIAGALGTYSRDAAPVIKKLENLKAEAAAFREKTDKDSKWREDGDLIDENLDRRNEIAEVWAEFQEVERAAYAKIVALVGGKPLRVNDGSNAKDMYGYDAEAMKQSKSLPWGDAVEESIPAWQIWEHAWEFGKGIVVDGIWGTLKGLGGLVGLQGWDVFKQSWTGLAKLGTGLAISTIPGVGPLFLAAPDDKLPSWLRDSRTAMKETGKALLAWDQWGSNPSRAAGAVTFNVVTTIFTGGAGGAASGAGKAGAVAKTLSFAGKAGRAIDPMTYIFKGAGAGFSKIGDVMAGLRGMGKVEVPNINLDGAVALPEGAIHLPDGAIHLPSGSAVPDGAVKLPDGNIKLPEGTTTFPPGTVKLPVDGPPRFMDPDGNIFKADGSLDQSVKDAPKGGPDAGADVPRTDAPKADTPATARVPERELVGVGGRGGDDVIRVGSDISDPVHAIDNAPRGVDATPVRVPEHELAGVGGRGGDHTPSGHAGDHTPGGHAPDNMPRGDLNNPGGTPRPDSPSPTGATHPDTPGSGATHGDGPGGTAGHGDGPAGSHPDSPGTGGTLPDGPGTSGVDDAARTGDDATAPANTATPGAGSPGASRVIPDPPSFMREGDNPYGPRGSLTAEQIVEIQVYRANYEPGYFKQYYEERGYRHLVDVADESGFPPKQLIKDPANPEVWITKDNAPPAFPAKYYDASWDRRGTAAQLNNPQAQNLLDEAARKRHQAVTADNKLHDPLAAAKKAWETSPTPQNKAAYDALKAQHAPYHDAMSKATEAYGEAVARNHVIPKFYDGAKWEPTAGPKNGNDQFDQVWRRKESEGFVVIEAKSDIKTAINERTLPTGYKARQGSREYFLDIMNEMWKRAQAGDAAELQLYTDLKKALIADKVEYILVKGDSHGPTHGGFKSRRFNIGTFKDEDFTFEATNRSNP